MNKKPKHSTFNVNRMRILCFQFSKFKVSTILKVFNHPYLPLDRHAKPEDDGASVQLFPI